MKQWKRAIPDWQKSRFVRLKTAGESHCVEILSQDMLVGIGFGGEKSLNLDQLVNSQEESRVVKLMAGDECFKLFFLVTISNTYKIISLDTIVKLSAFQSNQFWPLWAASQRGQTPRDWFTSANYYALLQPVIEMHRRGDSNKTPQGGTEKVLQKM